MAAIDCYRGYVNTWECDEIGHLNVQFFFDKLDEGLVHVRSVLGLSRARIAERGVTLRNRQDHIRYLAERHVGDGVCWASTVAGLDRTGIDLESRMTDVAGRVLAAGVRSRLEAVRTADGRPCDLPEAVADAAQALRGEADPACAPLGLAATDDLPGWTDAQAEAAGLPLTYRGAVQPWHCDANGWMGLRAYIGRISDGASNAFAMLGFDGARLRQEQTGGVALEQRIRYGRPLVAGDSLTMRSGLLALGRKTFELGHWLFSGDSGEEVAAMRVVVALFDLKARRTVAPTDADRVRMEQMRLPLRA